MHIVKFPFAEALNGNEIYSNGFGGSRGVSSCNSDEQKICEYREKNIVNALSRHPLILKMHGHPCKILKVALQVTNDLPNIGMLLIDENHHDGAEKTKTFV